MEAKFEKVVFNIVDGFLDKVSSTCIQDKDKLWGIWKEMFAFPALPVKEKKVVKSEVKPVEVKPVESKLEEGKTEEIKPEPKKAVRVKKMVESKVDEPKAAETPKVAEAVVVEAPKVAEVTKVAEAVVVEAPKVAEAVVEKPKMIVEEDDTKAEETKTDAKKCLVVLSRGPRKGEVCGSSVSTKDPSSGKCTVHLK